jgi:hypothetical protein
MYSIERNGREWVVMQAGNRVSLHPTKDEAQRTVEWLLAHHDITDASQAAARVSVKD